MGLAVFTITDSPKMSKVVVMDNDCLSVRGELGVWFYYPYYKVLKVTAITDKELCHSFVAICQQPRCTYVLN